MLGEMRKCPYFRSFLAFHSLVVEGDLCSFDAFLPLSEQVGFVLVEHLPATARTGFVLVPHTSGIQRGRMGRCSFHTRVVIHTVPGAVDESYPGTSFTRFRVRLQALRGGLG